MPGYALKSLLHHRLRLVISVLGIAIAIALILIINGFAEGFYKQASNFFRNTDSNLIVAENDEGLISNTSLLPRSLINDIEASDSVTEVSQIMFVPVIYNDVSITVIGYEDKNLGGPWKITEGRNIDKGNEIVLDQAFAEENNIKIGEKIKLLGQKLKVVGLSGQTASFISSLNFISLKKMRQLTNSEEMSGYFLIKSSNIKASEDSLEKNLKEGQVFTNQELGQSEEDDVRQVMSGPINIVNIIAFLIGLLVIALTAYVAALSKLNEFGILKAIGSSASKLFAIVLKQTFINTILGLVVGIGLGFVAANIIENLYPKFLIYITPVSLARISVLAVVLALLASIIPIRKVAAVDPVLVFK